MNLNNVLSEIIDFGCKVEFLQSKMRFSVISHKAFDADKYINSLKQIISKHEHNLSLLPSSGIVDIDISSGEIAVHKILIDK